MSSLKALVQKLVNATLTSTVGDLSSTVVFQAVTDLGYDPSAGRVNRVMTPYTCTCVQTKVQQTDTPDVTMISNGKKLLVPTAQLPNVNVDALDDTILLDGVSYTIKNVKVDTAGALYSFLVIAASGILSGAVHK